MVEMTPEEKDFWAKADVVAKPLASSLTAVAILVLGFCTSQVLEKNKAMETNAQLYSQLMSQREAADSALRKDMFNSVIQTFLTKGQGQQATPEEAVLNLELLAYNFHDSLNIEPLFLHVKRRIEASEQCQKERDKFVRRLEKVAREVAARQILILDAVGESTDINIDLKKLTDIKGKEKADTLEIGPFTLTVEGIKRSFLVVIQREIPEKKEIEVELIVERLGNSDAKGGKQRKTTAQFWAGLYDFPAIDNTRLPEDHRCALVITEYEKNRQAEAKLLCFPGRYAGLKDKTYYEDMVNNLRRKEEAFRRDVREFKP